MNTGKKIGIDIILVLGKWLLIITEWARMAFSLALKFKQTNIHCHVQYCAQVCLGLETFQVYFI